VVGDCGHKHVGILVDTLHFNRSRLLFVPVCDAPIQDGYTTQELLHAGRAERLPPGMGEIDIGSSLGHMPPDIPIALEVPMTAMTAAVGPEAVARLAKRSANRLFPR